MRRRFFVYYNGFENETDYWVSIGGVMLAAGVAGTNAAQTATFVGGYIAGLLAWAFLMAACFRWLQGRLRFGGPAFRAVTAGCGLALISLGLGLGWQAFGPLL